MDGWMAVGAPCDFIDFDAKNPDTDLMWYGGARRLVTDGMGWC
jgi:hypothetical protein